MNLNELAKRITEREGGKVNLSIAQVKEVLGITLELLAELPDDEVRRLMNRVVRNRRLWKRTGRGRSGRV
jgi:hypothetical protein